MTHVAADVLASIDLSDNDAFVDRVPYEWFDALRCADPVHWQPERHGRGFWAVTSHADVVAVSKDWATFSSQTGASALEDLAPDALAARRSMIDTDPPLHTELRRLVAAPFAVRPVRDYEGLVRSVTGQVLASGGAQSGVNADQLGLPTDVSATSAVSDAALGALAAVLLLLAIAMPPVIARAASRRTKGR